MEDLARFTASMFMFALGCLSKKVYDGHNKLLFNIFSYRGLEKEMEDAIKYIVKDYETL